ITPTTVFTCTVVPSATFCSTSTPAAGDGISASTLSVEISKRGSSRETLSPGFFSHLVRVPSKIDSPIWGMITSVGISVPSTGMTAMDSVVDATSNYKGKAWMASFLGRSATRKPAPKRGLNECELALLPLRDDGSHDEVADELIAGVD